MDNKEIVLKDFDPDTLAALLEFMYTAKITITEDNAQDILIGANLLLLYPVREAAGEVLGRLIDCSNVLLIRSLASAFSCREVETRAHNFLLERFEMVSKTEEFLKLDLAEVKKYLLMDDIIVRSEESIFECIIRWIEVILSPLINFIPLFQTDSKFSVKSILPPTKAIVGIVGCCYKLQCMRSCQ